MIKTTELMLGNIVEHEGKYVQVIALYYGDLKVRINGVSKSVLETQINPIPLTESVLKRLGMALAEESSVHELQNSKVVSGLQAIDVTPLLAPRYTTHDNVEVWEGDEVWKAWKDGITPYDGKIDKPTYSKNLKELDEDELMFSTQQACQAYIDSVTRKPIFTTEDGVDIYEGDRYWFCRTTGYNESELSCPMSNVCNKSNEHHDFYTYFSTHQLSQAYLNKVWAEKEFNDLLNAKKCQ